MVYYYIRKYLNISEIDAKVFKGKKMPQCLGFTLKCLKNKNNR